MLIMIWLKSLFPINSIFVCYNEVIPKSIIDPDNNCQVKLLAWIGHMISWMGHMIAHIGHMIKEKLSYDQGYGLHDNVGDMVP